MDHALFALKLAADAKKTRVNNAPVCLEDLRPDDDIGDAGLIPSSVEKMTPEAVLGLG